MTAAVALQDVTVRLGDRTVLDGVTLTIAPGEFIGVLGPNGAGKTTLFRTVLGLVRPAAGSVRVLGQPARGGNPSIGYVPQSRAAINAPRLRGWDFVAGVVDGHRLGLPWLGRAARASVDRALDLAGAAPLARRALSELSGGERQRLLLAQALVGQPRLLLLDEPLVSLDPNHQTAAVALAHAVGRELGIAVLFSAHELNPLLGVMDRVLYLGNGAAALGTVDDVMTGPVLTRLYATPIDVVRVDGRIFVMAGHNDVEHRHGALCHA